jgi:YVTN family beta-propeller protein
MRKSGGFAGTRSVGTKGFPVLCPLEIATGGSLSKIDRDTNLVIATIKLGFRPEGVVVDDGLVWVAVAPRCRS